MCGVVSYVGKPDEELLGRLLHESEIRGTHFTGKFVLGNVGIFHQRYITSGKAHQPIKKGKNVIAFNGVIDMGTKKEMEERWKVSLMTDNDAELVLQVCKSEADVIRFIGRSKVSFAGIVLMGSKFIACRNSSRPFYFVKVAGTYYFASTLDIFKRSGISKGVKLLESLKPYVWTI